MSPEEAQKKYDDKAAEVARLEYAIDDLYDEMDALDDVINPVDEEEE